jgi:hypothetical protein
VPFGLALLPAYALAGFAHVAEGYLRGRGKSSIGIYARLIAAAVMAAVAILGRDYWREFSIPLAAVAGQAACAACIVFGVVLDRKSEIRTSWATGI